MSVSSGLKFLAQRAGLPGKEIIYFALRLLAPSKRQGGGLPSRPRGEGPLNAYFATKYGIPDTNESVLKMKLLRPPKSQLKLWGKLSQTKYRLREGLFMAEGHKVVQELLKSKWETRAVLVMEEKRPQWNAFLSTVPEDIDVYGLSEQEWDTLSQDKAPEGIMAVAAMLPRPDTDELLSHVSGHVLLLYQINNPNNLGAVMRTAQWFGIGTIVLSSGSADFTNPKVVRSAMGSIFHLRVIADVDFVEIVPRIKERYLLVGSSIGDGIMPHACKQDTALLLGSESHGLPEALLHLTDEQWFIPGRGKADSLSLPQAASIMMYECTKQGQGYRG